ncbi:MAG: hypothetical protein JW867_04150 [Candidatus Omnitrophica bacterium]|nr:hypothetical protein [Candidatus Omnitrophota bacterium]
MNIRAATGTRLIFFFIFFTINVVVVQNIWLKNPSLNASDYEPDFNIPAAASLPEEVLLKYGLIGGRYPFLEISPMESLLFYVDLKDFLGALKAGEVLGGFKILSDYLVKTAIIKDEICSL